MPAAVAASSRPTGSAAADYVVVEPAANRIVERVDERETLLVPGSSRRSAASEHSNTNTY